MSQPLLKKIFFFSTLSIAALLIFFCRKKMLATCVGYLCLLASWFFGKELTFEAVTYDQGIFYFSNPKLYQQEQVFFKAKELKIHALPKSMSLAGILALELDHPQVHVENMQGPLSTKGNYLENCSKFLRFLSKVQGSQGSLIYQEQTYPFSFECALDKQIVTLEATLPSIPAPIFSKYLSVYESLRPYTLASGLIQGAFCLTFSQEGELIFFKTNIEGREFVVGKAQEKLRAYLGEITFASCFQKQIGKTVLLKDLSFKHHLEEMTPSVSIKDSSIFVGDLYGKPLWRAENIHFFASLSKQGIPEVAASGHILKGSRALPFSFQGKGVFEGFDSWNLDLENSAEIPLELKRCKRVGIKKKGPQDFAIALDVDGIDELDIHMLQELLDPILTGLDTYTFHKGKIKADLSCSIKQGAIQSIACHDLVVKDAHIEDKLHGISASIACFKAAALVEDPFSFSPKFHNWELSFNHLQIKNSFFKQELLLEGQMLYDKRAFFSSAIKASYAGASAICETYGTGEKQDIKMQWMLGNGFLSSLQQKVCARSKELQKLEKVFFDLTLEKNKEGLELKGSSLLEFNRGCQDEVFFHTTTKLNLSSFKDLNLEKVLSSKVFFSSNKVSANTYLLFLEPFSLKWFVLGDMKVEGSIDQKSLDFKTFSEKAVYDSEDVIVTLTKKQTLHYGIFHFDRASKRWDIFLPLRDVACEDKKFHLPFSHVDADITIQGSDLFAKNLKALCDNVTFSGLIHIDFKDPSWVDLQLYPYTMKGEVKDFIAFLSHILEPHLISFLSSAQGTIEGGVNNVLCLKYNQTQTHKKAHIDLHAKDITFPLTEKCCLANGNFSLTWDTLGNFLEIKDFSSKLLIEEGEGEKIYELKIPELSCKDLSALVFDIDMRLETSLLDLARLSGKVSLDNHTYNLALEGEHNHLFGAKLQYCNLGALQDLSLDYIETNLIFTDQHLSSLLEFLIQFDVFGKLLGKLPDPGCFFNFQDAELSFSKKKSKPEFNICLNAENVRAFSEQKTLKLEAIYSENALFSGHVLYGDGKALWALEKKEDFWGITHLEAFCVDGFIRSKQGQVKEACINLSFSHLNWNLETLKPIFKDKITPGIISERVLDGCLDLTVHLPFKDQPLCVEGVFNGEAHSKNGSDLSFNTKNPLAFTYTPREGLEIHQLELQFFQPTTTGAVSTIEWEKATFISPQKFSIKGAKLSLNPETLHYFIKNYPSVFINSHGDKLKISQAEFIWDNHLETQLDILVDEQALQIQGVLKEGYYWIGKESVYLQKIYYFLDQEHFNIVFSLDYQKIALDVLAKLQFSEEKELHLSIKPSLLDTGADEKAALEILCKHDNQEGLSIQSIQGELFGIECSFRKNPRAYAPHILLLTGHLRCHLAKFTTYFPHKSLAFFKDLGSGYELSGDVFLNKPDLLLSHFKGYLKGRDFHFHNFYFKTLMSEVDIRPYQMHIHDLCLSDLSGMLKIKEIKIHKDEDLSWKMKIPEVVLQDFRPSFLRKSLNQEEKIKPLVIKNLHIFNVEGTLGNLQTFKGQGYLDFINTFKREMHILDIPIEIIGRIGFDLGIFIPVIGKLEFEMHQGKIVLKELKNTFSEGRRSRFYLSGYKDSFIGLDGQLAIDIKMKQYVLLKFTEPFTLSIRGTVTKPRYSLR
jgi:hypothetical protein